MFWNNTISERWRKRQRKSCGNCRNRFGNLCEARDITVSPDDKPCKDWGGRKYIRENIKSGENNA